jgi:hypothetical protein
MGELYKKQHLIKLYIYKYKRENLTVPYVITLMLRLTGAQCKPTVTRGNSRKQNPPLRS